MYILPILAGLTLIFFFSFSIGLLLEKIRIPGIIAPLLVGVVFKIIPFFSFLKQKGTFGCFDFLASLGVIFLLFTALVAASAFSTLSVPLLTSFILDKWKEELR